jgi:hypothetical protein
VLVPTLKPLEAQMRDNRVLNGFVRMANQPSCVKGGVSRVGPSEKEDPVAKTIMCAYSN